MTYDEWLKSVPPELTEDPLWRMEVFRYALIIGDLSWHDVSKVVEDKRALRLSSQLYSAVGSIAANIAKGYTMDRRKTKLDFMNMLWARPGRRESGIIKVRIFFQKMLQSIASDC